MKITLIQAVLGGGLSICFVIFFSFRAQGVLLLTGLVAMAAGLAANLGVKEYVRLSTITRGRLKELVSYSWPLLGLNLFAFFTRSLDRIFLAGLTSLSGVGIFSVSYMIAGIFETLISGFFFAWGPYMLSTFHETWAPLRYARYFGAFSCLGIISIVTLGLWGAPAVLLIRPEGTYQDIGVYIPWIISGTLLYYLGGYFAPGPAIRKRTYWKLIGFMLAAICNAGLNYALIPRLGILGAGIATTASGLVAGVFNQLVSNKLYYVPNPWKSSFILVLVFTAFVSFVQAKNPIWHISGVSAPLRAALTAVLIIAGSIPYLNDIKDLGIFRKASAAILNVVQRRR
jgi:O-antigen/teichoic acid export membrane protein